MSLTAQNKSFKGRHDGRLDDKRRLTIPAEWRFEGEGESAYLAFFNPAAAAIMVLPPKSKTKIEAASERSEVISNPAMLRALERLGELSQDIVCDKAGRVILRPEILRAAGIDRDVELKGVFSNFLIRSVTPPAPDLDSKEAKELEYALSELMK